MYLFVNFRIEAERRIVWLYEVAVLTGLCVIIYLCDHFPFILVILTVTTLIVTQFINQLSLHQWWTALQTRWDEYQQHQESIHRDQRLSTQQHGYQCPPQQPNLMARTMQKLSSALSVFIPQSESRNVASSRLNRSHSQVNSNSMDPGRENPQVTVRWRGKGLHQVTPEVYSKRQSGAGVSGRIAGSGSVGNLRGVTVNNTSLPTKAIPSISASSVSQSPTARKQPRQTSDHNLSFKSKVLSVFGINPYVKVPPGLKNEGQNLCFMNCVLQCLARTPHLLDRLATEAYEEASCSVAESAFTSALTELLRYCNTSPGTSDIAALDPVALQQAASYLPGSPVVPLGHRQTQQDAGEFLMWLLSTVHSVLNKNRKGKEGEININIY